ncbi:YeiH family protein [Stappia sp. TSB10P1A]|uniref:YeiH family protein n=1 Tax=Stappia sp. TSB10P1A TaxID=2003585 RepID=UPI001643DEE3|nr:putative sulfate exporter family transporter [Stappia sp. TSB10P1A]
MNFAGSGKYETKFAARVANWGHALPGLALCVLLALAGEGLRRLPGLDLFGPMALAMALGLGLRAVLPLPALVVPGVRLAAGPLLRAAVVLLGLQLTLADLLSLGLAGLAVTVTALLATFALTLWLGRRLGVAPELARLIAAGTSICGASAVAAARTVTGASAGDAAYAVACVTLFGTLAMVLMPLLPPLAGLDAAGYGLLVGASVHEVAQVAGAGFRHSAQAGEAAMVAKLSRVLLLAPMVLGLAAWLRRGGASKVAQDGAARLPLPWFVFGFLAMVLVASSTELPEAIRAGAGMATTFLMTMALAGLGLGTDLREIAARGPRPLLLAALAALFIAALALLMVKVLM